VSSLGLGGFDTPSLQGGPDEQRGEELQLGVRLAEVTVRLNVYTTNGLTLREIEEYWLGLLGQPRTCLRGHTLTTRRPRAAA
jgi:hypothetical protein